MYIIAKGECTVTVLDEENRELDDSHRKIIRSGEYFGEISLIYKCRRTCTVVSRKYSTLAKLNHEKFRDITAEFPDLITELKEGIYRYRDRMKKFLMSCIKRIEFFNEITLDAMHDLLYNLEGKTYEKG